MTHPPSMSDPHEQETPMSTIPSSPASPPRTGTPATSSPSGIVPNSQGRGTTTIADTVVERIVALSSEEVPGVAKMGGAASSAIAGVVSKVRSGPSSTGVTVEVGETQAAVDITLIVEYPHPVHEVAEAVRENVKRRVEHMTDLMVTEVNVTVSDLAFASDEDDAEDSADRVQ